MKYEQYLKEHKDEAEKSLRAGCLSADVYVDLFGELPENLTVSGLYLSPGFGADKLGLEKLPPGLTVRGAVKMYDTEIRELPDDIRIEWGDLTIGRSPLERLPENLKVPGELRLVNVPLGEIPEGLSASHLHLSGCYELREIAGDLKVAGLICIEGCRKLKSLPEGLHCEDLCICYAGIAGLPGGLVVKEDLSISNCADLTEFPDDMEAGGNVWISEMGDFRLPEGFTVKGNLTIRDCPDLTALPKGLVVYGRTEIENTGIRTLPDNAIFGGDVILRGSSFETLPDGLVVAGDLDIRETGIRTLPENMVIGRTLNIMDLPVTVLPKSLKVGYDIISSLRKSLPNSLCAGDYEPGRFVSVCGGLVHTEDHFISDGKGMARVQDRKRPSRIFCGEKRSVRRKIRTYKYDYFAGKIPGRNALSDGKNCIECINLRDGIFEFTYRKREYDSRGTGQYADVTMDTVLPADEMAAMYRFLTDDYLEDARKKIAALEDLKESYSVREFAGLTKGWEKAGAFTGFINRKQRDTSEKKEGDL